MENNLTIQNQAISLIDSVDLQAIQGTMQKIATFQAVIQKNWIFRLDSAYFSENQST